MKKNGMNKMAEIIAPVEKNRKPLIIGVITISILLLLAAALFFNARQPLAGKATQYGTEVTGTVQEQWGVLISDASAGAPWTKSDGTIQRDEVDATVFVNFGSPGASFSTLRLRLNYDPDALEPVSVTPLHDKYQSDLGSQINTADDSVLGYYTWSGSASELQTYRVTGQQSLFRVRFRVIAPDPGTGNNQEYASAVSLVNVPPTVLNNDAGTSYGVYSTASGNEDVQMIAATPNPASLALTVYPGCYDDDGDGYAPTGRDKQACGPLFQADDCNDGDSDVRPGGTEECNAIDDDCDAQIDESLPLRFNDLPTGSTQLHGICLGYQSCTAGNWVNSYEQIGSAYTPNTDACDFFDNDCDGQLNENAVGNCDIGGAAVSPNVGQIASAVPGNVYIDYSNNAHTVPQLFDLSDRLLYNLLWSTRERTDCGVAGQEPCTAAFDANTQVWFCRNNLYYVVAGETVKKHSADGQEESISATTVSEVPECE